MKKILSLVILLISLFLSSNETIAYFNTSDNFVNIFTSKDYVFNLNANGGYFSNQDVVVQDNSTILPTPTRTGYTFLGYSDSLDGNVNYSINIDNVDLINNKNIYAQWDIDSYLVDVNPIIDGTIYSSGLSGYTFDIYVNEILVADDVMDWCQYVNYGTIIRVITNEKVGHTSGFDQTIIVGTGTNEIRPSWTRNTYQGHFYYVNTSGVSTFWTATNNKYGDYISTPSVDNVGQFGYDDNFYKFVDFSAWTTWYQPEYAVGFTVNITERTCRATFGTLSVSNATYQQTKFHNAGYSYCNVNSSNTNEVECKGTYSQVLSAYNAAWNGVLPTSGNGFSRYRDMACDSGWTTYSTR